MKASAPVDWKQRLDKSQQKVEDYLSEENIRSADVYKQLSFKAATTCSALMVGFFCDPLKFRKCCYCPCSAQMGIWRRSQGLVCPEVPLCTAKSVMDTHAVIAHLQDVARRGRDEPSRISHRVLHVFVVSFLGNYITESPLLSHIALYPKQSKKYNIVKCLLTKRSKRKFDAIKLKGKQLKEENEHREKILSMLQKHRQKVNSSYCSDSLSCNVLLHSDSSIVLQQKQKEMWDNIQRLREKLDITEGNAAISLAASRNFDMEVAWRAYFTQRRRLLSSCKASRMDHVKVVLGTQFKLNELFSTWFMEQTSCELCNNASLGSYLFGSNIDSNTSLLKGLHVTLRTKQQEENEVCICNGRHPVRDRSWIWF